MLSTLVGRNPQDGEEFSSSNTRWIYDEFNFPLESSTPAGLDAPEG